MIEPQPRWQITLPQPPSLSVPDCSLTPRHIIVTGNGRNFTCLERATGRTLWQRRKRVMERADTFKGQTDGVLIFSERRSHDGPWTADFGVYAYSAANGKRLWINHAPRGWGRFVGWLDWIPDFTNDLREAPFRVADGKVTTSGGRILDARTGEETGRVPDARAVREQERSLNTRLRFQHQLDLSPFGIEGTLHQGLPGVPKGLPGVPPLDPDGLHLQELDGMVRWTFDIWAAMRETGLPVWRSRFVVPPHLYYFMADGANQLPGKELRYRPSLYFLWTIDLRDGRLVQQEPLNTEPAIFGGIQAADEQSLLIYWRTDDNSKPGDTVLTLYDRLPAT